MTSSPPSRKRDEQLYSLLSAAKTDLSQATFFANHLLKKGWHHEPWERRRSVYLQQAAYTTAFATAYSRPFTQVRNQPAFPVRLLSGYTTSHKTLHHRILDLRNKLYAHSDIEQSRASPFDLEGNHVVVEFIPAMKLSREDLVAATQMIEIAETTIQVRLEQLFLTLAREA